MVSLAPAIPGIAAFASGELIAQHADGSLVTDSSPAHPGEYVVTYLSGLGAVDTPVASGSVSPSSPLAHPVIAPVVTWNGSPIPTAFAGLTPGSIGLYQINFQVPAVVVDGLAQIVITQGSAASNQGLLPVQNLSDSNAVRFRR